jgi:glycine/D-amino acid oxidase-like deaminating enzyme
MEKRTMADPNEQAQSYWIGTTARTNFPVVTSGLSADVVVVGAGIVGITAAFLIKRAGRSVILVESRRAAEQVTGGTTAKITSLHSLIYAEMVRKFGDDIARSYGESNQAALEFIAGLVRERQIECDFERKAANVYSESKDQLDTLREEAAAAAGLGLPAHFVTSAPAPLPIAGAVRFDNQAQFHPRKYLLDLLQDVSRGAHVFENSRVIEVDDGTPCQIHTDRGDITA